MNRRVFIPFALAAALLTLMLCGATVLAEGTVTITGVVLGLNDQPVAGWPLHIQPHLPNAGNADRSNSFYKIPNYDQHLVFTDDNGRFTMSGVIDYPQVTQRKYRLWSVTEETEAIRLKSNPFIRTTATVDLSKAVDGKIYVVVRGEPGAALKVTAKCEDGRPFSGMLNIAIISGQHTYLKALNFRDGVGISPAVPAGNAQQPGRVIFLPPSATPASSSALIAQGKDLSVATIKGEGVIADRLVQFMPFQWANVEITIPNQYSGSQK